MKTRLLSLCGILFAALSSASAQTGGPLTPPGAPGNPATAMPSLTEIYGVAKRFHTVIPAQTTAYTITQPGSYVLGGNITVATGNGININSSGVTLDLNGFAIKSTSASKAGDAIAIGSGAVGVRIHGGRLTSTATSGFIWGISFDGFFDGTTNLVFEDLSFEGWLSVRHNVSDLLSPSVVIRQCSFDTANMNFLNDYDYTLFCKLIDCEFRSAHSVVGSNVYAEVVENCVGIRNFSTGPGPDGRYRISSPTSSYTIIHPGSYVLSDNIEVISGNAVVITVSNVTLDLNGFAIRSSAGSPSNVAIQIEDGCQNVTIRNGNIEGDGVSSGFLRGIWLNWANNTTSTSLVFEDVRFNGLGIALGTPSVTAPSILPIVTARRLTFAGGPGITFNFAASGTKFGTITECQISGAGTFTARHIVNRMANPGRIFGTTVVGSTP